MRLAAWGGSWVAGLHGSRGRSGGSVVDDQQCIGIVARACEPSRCNAQVEAAYIMAGGCHQPDCSACRTRISSKCPKRKDSIDKGKCGHAASSAFGLPHTCQLTKMLGVLRLCPGPNQTGAAAGAGAGNCSQGRPADGKPHAAGGPCPVCKPTPAPTCCCTILSALLKSCGCCWCSCSTCNCSASCMDTSGKKSSASTCRVLRVPYSHCLHSHCTKQRSVLALLQQRGTCACMHPTAACSSVSRSC